MANFTMKTYNDSYLYKTKISNNQKDNFDKKATAALKDFIITCKRIEDKDSDSFRGIAEEVKRQSRSNLIFSILMLDNVKLCIGPYELSRAFKVMDAKDPKNNAAPTVFIDVTGLIEYKNGYYYCRKPDVLIAYLFDALIYLLYRYYPTKIMENAIITQSATECYVSLFTYIIDYLRIIGYSVNKNKINYMIALFFLHNMMGKDLDKYVKELAAKIADIDKRSIDALDLYIEDGECFENIATFIDMLTNVFKLKAFNIQVFVSKWMYLYGTGTEYACELYTSLLVLLANGYSGSYIVGQRQIERCCGTSMVKLITAIEKAGSTSFDMRGFMSESQLTKFEVHDKNTTDLAESIKLKKQAGKYFSIDESDFHIVGGGLSIVESAKKFSKNANIDKNRLSKFAENCIKIGIESAYNGCLEAAESGYSPYVSGSILETTKALKGILNESQNRSIDTLINNKLIRLNELRNEDNVPSNGITDINNVISEMRELKQYI